jgi:hypothetical protein
MVINGNGTASFCFDPTYDYVIVRVWSKEVGNDGSGELWVTPREIGYLTASVVDLYVMMRYSRFDSLEGEPKK